MSYKQSTYKQETKNESLKQTSIWNIETRESLEIKLSEKVCLTVPCLWDFSKRV